MSDIRAVVREEGGRLVLDDPDAIAVVKAVEKHNCRLTLDAQADRVAHFKRRAVDKGVDRVAIVLLNVDDPNGKAITDILMPGQDGMWQSLRESGQVPFARGLATRDGMQIIVDDLDADEGERLRAMTGEAVVIVADRGVVAVFAA